jgi:hypothetical protein
VQAGTEQNYDSVEAAYYDAWVEDYPFNEPQQITGMSVACGNLMSVYVSSDYDYRNQVYYSVFNESTNVYYGHAFGWPLTTGARADWIVERHLGFDLANFHSVTFNSCKVVRFKNSNPIYLGSTPYESDVMWSSIVNGQPSGNKLAAPGSISGGSSFTVTWYNPS